MTKHWVWYQKYRPDTINECVLPVGLKEQFQNIVCEGKSTDLILNGSPGIGKTTVARTICKELDWDLYFINGALNGSIDTLRNDILQFVSTMSFTSEHKVVIIDEADRMSAQMQDGLKTFMEEFTGVTYIFTTNNKSKLIGPIHSRSQVIDFAIPKDEQQKILVGLYKRAVYILDSENVTYDKAVVAKLISKYFPDFRRALNELQGYYIRNGSIDSGILAAIRDVSLADLYKFMKEKSFTNVRKWVAENLDSDVSAVIRKIFDTASEVFTPATVPMVILILAKYEYQSTFAVDQEISLTACLTEILCDAEFK
jgi:replication factor C small subunit